MAYRTPEERISEAVGQGWRKLGNRFAGLRGEIPQTAAAVEPPAPVAPVQPTASQLAKVPTNIAGSMPGTTGMQAQPVTAVFSANKRFNLPDGVSAGASYDTGRAFTQVGDQVNFAGPNGMRQAMSLKQFYDQMNPTTQAPGSNYDVTFDPSVSQEARQRFMEQPVAPTGQMRQYENYMNTPRGQNFGVRPLNQDQSGLLTRENAPAGMGWQERKALNEQMLQNRQSGINAELQAEVTREGLRPTAQEQAQTEVAQIGLRSAQRIETALRDYETADTPAKKAAALERYRLLTKTKDPTETKPEIRTESIVENGVMRDRTVAITVDKDGSITKREVPEAGQGAGAPTAAINERMLKNKNDPVMVEDYVKLFGKEAYEKNIGPLPK